jgi:hypothetical protein
MKTSPHNRHDDVVTIVVGATMTKPLSKPDHGGRCRDGIARSLRSAQRTLFMKVFIAIYILCCLCRVYFGYNFMLQVEHREEVT